MNGSSKASFVFRLVKIGRGAFTLGRHTSFVGVEQANMSSLCAEEEKIAKMIEDMNIVHFFGTI